jgi:hypothetical protein
LAAKYGSEELFAKYRARADFFFDRCLDDLLSFETARLTRPLVILCVHGAMQGYFQQRGVRAVLPARPDYNFGVPEVFVPQKARAASTLRRKLRVAASDLGRLARQSFRALRYRWL